MTLALLALAIVLLNLPFGWWREGSRKFSPAWFIAIHAPVPVVWFLRTTLGIGWGFATFPVLVGAFFGGQYIGGRLRRRQMAGRAEPE